MGVSGSGRPLRAVVSPDGVRLAVAIVHAGAPMEVAMLDRVERGAAVDAAG